MNFHAKPDAVQKLDQMADAARFEPAGDNPVNAGKRESRARSLPCVSHVATPGGSKPILKTMLTTACEKNCFYCPFRAAPSTPRRVTFQPDDMPATSTQIQPGVPPDAIV